MNAYAVVYKDKSGYIEYVKKPNENTYMIFDNNETAIKAVSFVKEYYKELLKPKVKIKRRFFKKEITYERLPDVIKEQYTRILKTVHIKKVSIL